MATNNNLIPINIKDLPKLDILSNSDLIPIETVEGTATILYRDFIIDEAHTTFAATLSASVTNAVALSSAIDTTNATVKTVSASLYSSITGLSSSSFAYSNALSSSLVSLNATVTALSSDLYALSSYSTTSISTNTSNIATLSSNTQIISAAVVSLTSNGLSSRGLVVGSNTPFVYILTTPINTAATGNFFNNPSYNPIKIKANKTYILRFNLFYAKSAGTTGTMTFTISTAATFTNIVATLIHANVSGIEADGTTISCGAIGTGSLTLPNVGSVVTNKNHSATIEAVIENISVGSTDCDVVLSFSSSSGTIAPLRGSSYTLTEVI